MRKIIGIAAASAFAIAAISAPVAADPSQTGIDASCFGQVHKAVNQGALVVDNEGPVNVGQFVTSLANKGQDKKAAVKAPSEFCPPTA